jgi:N,N'-diacetylchitobiose phosphorylase
MKSRAPSETRTAQAFEAARECVLSNPHYRTLVTPSGSGFSSCDDTTLTAWSRDSVEDRDGYFFYLRDPALGAFWSMGRRPIEGAPQHYAVAAGERLFAIERVENEVAARLEIVVPAEGTLELRRLSLVNLARRTRAIEVTSYAEVVLHAWEAHASHPAFSRLFVQTEWLPARGALLAHRRPRGAGERHPWLVHASIGAGALEHETDRVRFIGRGRTLANPRAIASGAPLSGATGNVLDPIVSLRRSVEIEPRGGVALTFLMGAAPDRDAALALLDPWRDRDATDEAFARAGSAEPMEIEPPAGNGRASGAASNGNGRHGEAVEIASERRGASAQQSEVAPETPLFDAPLRYANGVGGFSQDGREYVIRLEHRGAAGLRLPPRPWVNVLANETFGCIVSETGAGPTFSRNSREHRLTPWSNDALLDPHGEALYVRDESSGATWSPLPGPMPAEDDYEMRHGFGYSECRHRSHGLDQETLVFVARHDPVKLVRLSLTNLEDGPRALSLYAYQHLVLGGLPSETAPFVSTEIDEPRRAALAWRTDDEADDEHVAFAAVVAPDRTRFQFACDREEFLGKGRGPERPQALDAGAPLSGAAGSGLDPCFASRLFVQIPAGATIQVTFLLGEGHDARDARALIDRYRVPEAVTRAFEEIHAFWDEMLASVRIETPAPEIDLMVNGWLAYQTLACRIWARSAAYQSGGAFGFRDQLQDALALTWYSPAIAREQILRNGAHQFAEGDVLHWWHPPGGHGLRTRFADDRLWLPFLTATYVAATGDAAVMDERLPFLAARALDEGEDEAYLESRADGDGDLYDHCCRAIDVSLEVGAHGVPLFGSGDWNDGMNRVGREGRGESVWMGFFLFALLGTFDTLCARRGDDERRARYADHRARLLESLNAAAWDGDWYLRGWYDDGGPLGSHLSDECRIDALAQAWAVLSGAAPAERAARALDAVEEHLISEREGLIRLLTPPFENTPHDPGYIQGYVRGVRENGGQYTHAALWVVQALAALRRRDRAAHLLRMLSPVTHAATPERMHRYEVEPYVIAADVYGAAPHVGRGGWTWYTGSAGWMLRVALESVLGLTIEGGDCLIVRPCVPDDWPGWNVVLRLPGDRTRYQVRASTRGGRAAEVVEARLDGRAVTIVDGAARVPLIRDGAEHQVEIVLG